VDFLSVAGLILAVVAIGGGRDVEGCRHPSTRSLAAFVIVVLGTVAAICVQTSLSAMKRALNLLPWIVKPPAESRRCDDRHAGAMERRSAKVRSARIGTDARKIRGSTIFCAKVCRWSSTAANPSRCAP